MNIKDLDDLLSVMVGLIKAHPENEELRLAMFKFYAAVGQAYGWNVSPGPDSKANAVGLVLPPW